MACSTYPSYRITAINRHLQHLHFVQFTKNFGVTTRLIIPTTFATIMARVLLVHGAMADGSSWTKVMHELQKADLSVTAVQQPLTAIEDDVKVVRTAIKTLQDASSEPIVVVGHSFGGVVVTNAAAGWNGFVKALVYVHAFAPDEGETVAELSKPFPELESNKLFVADASGRLSMKPADFLKYFAPDLPTEEAAILAATQGPCDGARFRFVTGPPAWREVKNLFYIVADGDQIITPELETYVAKRMGAKTTHLAGASHAGFVSQLEPVAKVIIEAASTDAA